MSFFIYPGRSFVFVFHPVFYFILHQVLDFVLYQVLRFCVAVPRVLRISDRFHSFSTFATTYASTTTSHYEKQDANFLQALLLPIRHKYMVHQPAFQGSLEVGSSSLKFQAVPTSKHRTNPSVCLNNTVFCKRYYLVGSIYVLRLVTEHHMNHWVGLKSLLNSYVCYKLNVIFTKPQYLLRNYGFISLFICCLFMHRL